MDAGQRRRSGAANTPLGLVQRAEQRGVAAGLNVASLAQLCGVAGLRGDPALGRRPIRSICSPGMLQGWAPSAAGRAATAWRTRRCTARSGADEELVAAGPAALRQKAGGQAPRESARRPARAEGSGARHARRRPARSTRAPSQARRWRCRGRGRPDQRFSLLQGLRPRAMSKRRVQRCTTGQGQDLQARPRRSRPARPANRRSMRRGRS